MSNNTQNDNGRGSAAGTARTVAGAGSITPTEQEKSEWSRLAKAAYAADQNDIGHRFSMAATLRIGESMALAQFDALQVDYSNWLIGYYHEMTGFRSEEKHNWKSLLFGSF